MESVQDVVVAEEEGDPVRDSELTELLEQQTSTLHPAAIGTWYQSISFSAAIFPRTDKLERYAGMHWNSFYRHNSTHGYKDRHYLLDEFPELLSSASPVVFEIGCGVGNAFFPLLQGIPSLKVLACDFAKSAVELVQRHPLYDASRVTVFQHNILLPFPELPLRSKYCILLFVLSSLSPESHAPALQNIYNCLPPGSLLYFRDYAFLDHAQIRFKEGNRLGRNFYVRQNGTRSYFFQIDEVRSLFESLGWRTVALDFVRRKIVNRKEQKEMHRVWLHGKFFKPETTASTQ